MKLTKTELLQLLTYCDWIEESGLYYGPIKEFEKRDTKIRVFLRQLLDKEASK